jgi:flagellar biosynthesis chaperone FliJ
METFRYRLQPLLDRKAARKLDAERALAAARQRLCETEAELAEARERLGALEDRRAARRSALLVAETGAEDLRRRVDDLALLGRRVEDVKDEAMALRRRIEERKEEVDSAVAALADAARELEVLNKHRAKGERRFRADQDRKDAAAQDEIASALFARRRS